MGTKINSYLTYDTLFKLTYDFKENGKVVGFTHGAFDLFHMGHLYLLSQASMNCDFLIVAIESDENIRSYKKDNRPIINQRERWEILNSINCVGSVFINTNSIFDDWYVYLYKELHIDFLAVGRDFSGEDIARERTSRVGIKLLKFDTDLQSTGKIIKKIKRKF